MGDPNKAIKELTDLGELWISVARGFGSDFPEDDVQEMYIKFLKNFDPSRHTNKQGELIRAFPYKYLKHIIFDRYKKRKIQTTSLEWDVPEKDTSTEDKINLFELSKRVDSVLLQAEKEGALHWYDIQIYNLYTRPEKPLNTKKISIRQLAKRLNNTSYMTIFGSIKVVKECLREKLGDEYLKLKTNV